MILSHLRAAVLAAFPGLDAPKSAVFRVVRAAVERLNLQPVSGATDQTRDLSAVEVWPGVPGVSSEPTPGETVALFFTGADGTPAVIGRAPKGAPGHVPVWVNHEATTSIRFVSESNGDVVVGVEPLGPVAMANPLVEYLVKLEAYHVQIDALLIAVATFIGYPSGSIAVAIVERIAAAGYAYPLEGASFSAVRSTRLFAQQALPEPGPPFPPVGGA